jgi:hypothetical protein
MTASTEMWARSFSFWGQKLETHLRHGIMGRQLDSVPGLTEKPLFRPSDYPHSIPPPPYTLFFQKWGHKYYITSTNN